MDANDANLDDQIDPDGDNARLTEDLNLDSVLVDDQSVTGTRNQSVRDGWLVKFYIGESNLTDTELGAYSDEEQIQFLRTFNELGITQPQLEEANFDPWKVLLHRFSEMTDIIRIRRANQLSKCLDFSVEIVEEIFVNLICGFFDDKTRLSFEIIPEYLYEFPILVIECVVKHLEKGRIVRELESLEAVAIYDFEYRVHHAMLLAAFKEIAKILKGEGTEG
jgi:hypothetical protein